MAGMPWMAERFGLAVTRWLLLCGYLLLSACTTLATAPMVPSHALARPADTPLAQHWERVQETHDGLSGFSLMPDALDAFVARAMLIESAGKTLDVQYYSIQDDTVGKLLVQRLLAAADRGVRVRVLIDDIYANRSDKVLRLLQAHPQIEVRLFNPWKQRTLIGRAFESVVRVSRLNHRMHNKLLVADNAVAILGGRNIGDEYFNLNDDLDFRDIDVLAAGPVVGEASQSFDHFWNSDWVRAIKSRDNTAAMARLRQQLDEHLQKMAASPYARALTNTAVARALREQGAGMVYAPAQVLADLPEKVVKSQKSAYRDNSTLLAQLEKVMPRPQHSLWISSPYFVPGSDGSEALGAMVQRGVDVRVLTNSLVANDVPLVHSGYAPYRENLLRAGVKVFELKRNPDQPEPVGRRRLFASAHASLHAKAFVMDDETLVVGSANLDPRSLLHNTEIALVIRSRELAGQLSAWYRNVTLPDASYALGLDEQGRLRWYEEVNGESRVWTREPEASWWERSKSRIISWLPIRSQI